MRPAGVEPTFPASEADALSIELRARKIQNNGLNCYFYLYFIILQPATGKKHRINFFVPGEKSK